MISHKRILHIVAKKYSIDPDELLVNLWEFYGDKFNYLKNENDIIKNNDYKHVKKILSSKTRSEKIKKTIKKISKPIEIIQKEHDFGLVGKLIQSMDYINKEEVLKIYHELVSDFDSLEDPIQPSGIKDEDLLDSAIFHGQTSFENFIKYPTAESAAAALMYALSHNHAFHNGNKRTAMVAMLVFLDRHNICLICNEDDLFKISLKLADHKLVSEEQLYPDAEIYELARWIHSNSKVVAKGERPITLKKLKQIFDHFDCVVLDNGRVQKIKKTVSFLGYSKKIKLISKRTIGDTISDGQEIDKGLIKSIREDLELNPDNGIDSDVFYERANFTSSDFIIKYKGLLKRLSKV